MTADLNALTPAIDQLKNHQRQLDQDGCFVGVSRQAIDEVLTYLSALTTAATPPSEEAIEFAKRELRSPYASANSRELAKAVLATPPTTTPSAVPDGVQNIELTQRLMKFYGAETIEGLIATMEEHIGRLQSKLPKPSEPRSPSKVREG